MGSDLRHSTCYCNHRGHYVVTQMTLFDDLERLARAASTLPAKWWKQSECENMGTMHGKDAAYIAACSPEVVLALVECVKAADAMRSTEPADFELVHARAAYAIQREAFDAARARLEESCPKT